MTKTDLIATVRARLSKNALECLEAVARTEEDQDAMIGSDIDVGALNTETLLEKCLDGAEGDDVIAGWTEYVEVIGRVAAGHFHQGRTTEETTNQHGRQALIQEQGNGYPDVGDYVRGEDGALYRVQTIGSHIRTASEHGIARAGGANVISATVEPADWSDCEEGAEFSALVLLGIED